MKPATERLLCDSHRPHLALALECLSSSISYCVLVSWPRRSLVPTASLSLLQSASSLLFTSTWSFLRPRAEHLWNKQNFCQEKQHSFRRRKKKSQMLSLTYCPCRSQSLPFVAVHVPRCLKTSFLRMFKTSFSEEGIPCPRPRGRGTTEEFLSP